MWKKKFKSCFFFFLSNQIKYQTVILESLLLFFIKNSYWSGERSRQCSFSPWQQVLPRTPGMAELNHLNQCVYLVKRMSNAKLSVKIHMKTVRNMIFTNRQMFNSCSNYAQQSCILGIWVWIYGSTLTKKK